MATNVTNLTNTALGLSDIDHSFKVAGGMSLNTVTVNADLTTQSVIDLYRDAGVITAPVGNPPVFTVAPAVTGTPTVGQTLTGTNGIAAGATFTRQWQMADAEVGPWTNIYGATGATRVLGAGESGKYVSELVTATNAFGTTQARSNVIGPVAAA